jgi:uncharacterized protein (UPF0248 family)
MRKWDQQYKVEVLDEDGKWIKQLGTKEKSIKRIKEIVRMMDGTYDYGWNEKIPKARIVKIKRRGKK